MAVRLVTLHPFQSKTKRFLKKFASLEQELNQLLLALQENPKLGKSMGGGFYKIRLASKSKGTGKSGGFRIITYFLQKTKDGETLYLVTLYDKSEEATISKQDLEALVVQYLD